MHLTLEKAETNNQSGCFQYSQILIKGDSVQGKQQVVSLPIPTHLPGRNSHQWEEIQRETENAAQLQN